MRAKCNSPPVWTREKRERGKQSGERPLRSEFFKSSCSPIPTISFAYRDIIISSQKSCGALKGYLNSLRTNYSDYSIVGWCSTVRDFVFFFFYLRGNDRNGFDSSASLNRFIVSLVTWPGAKNSDWELGMAEDAIFSRDKTRSTISIRENVGVSIS